MEVIAAKLAGHIQHFANNIKVWRSRLSKVAD